ncbi:MAG: HDIG domain-containing protein [Deltaproteobacteria bacterium]|nr:HDIG domain-containing protein [Deltaproteobacteria bacterium]
MKLFAPIKKKKTSSKIDEPKKTPFIPDSWMGQPAHRILVSILLSAVIALLIAPRLVVPTYHYQTGDIAKHNIRAPRDFSVEDRESTEKRRAEKTEGVRPVYDYNSRAEAEIEKRITGAFNSMREALRATPQSDTPKFFTIQKKRFETLIKSPVSDKDFSLLLQRSFKKEIEDFLLDLILPFSQQEIVLSKEQLFKERSRGIILRDIYTKQEIVAEDLSPLADLKEAQSLIKREARKLLKKVRTDVRRTITTLAVQIIEPTLTFNKVETTARKQTTAQEISPLYYNVKKGEIIVREGAKTSDAILVKLKALSSMKNQTSMWGTVIGYFLLSFFSLHILFRFSSTAFAPASGSSITQRDLVFLCSCMIVTFLLLKFCASSAKVFSKGYTAIPLDAYFYAIPFSFAAIVISVVLSPQFAALSAVVVSFYACLLLDGRFEFFVYSFISALVAAQEVGQSRERKTIIRAGLIVGGTNMLLIISLYLTTGDLFKIEPLMCIGLGVLGGLLAAVLATGIIPITEIIFNYTTDIKLLELADLNQPVLRRLLIAAPGTYHHSILVGILSEAAAEAIKANPLLTRVSSYYHDIGKITKPLYFVENQKSIENKHDKLLPSMSSLIITAHIKDGIELAKKYRLGKPIQDIISQHHGTSVITYFYQKAKDQQDETGQPVNDKDFRYPGPRPQTKEAGIVMLADAVQAASMTLSEPTPARIQGMVQRIINNIFADGQLDECELTLKDLHLIAENFIRILNGIFHSRIEYPETTEKEPDGKDIDRKSAKPDSNRDAADSATGERDLKRIGIKKSRGKHTAA